MIFKVHEICVSIGAFWGGLKVFGGGHSICRLWLFNYLVTYEYSGLMYIVIYFLHIVLDV